MNKKKIDLAIQDLIDMVVIELAMPSTDDQYDEVLDNWDNHIDAAKYVTEKIKKIYLEEV